MTTISNSQLVLVDGSSYLYRAFHAYPDSMSNGEIMTNAIYGVINMLKSLIKQYDTERFAVIFDAKGKTFRDEIYSDYKANRAAMPDALRDQIPGLFDLINAMGLPLIAHPGVEADDVIGTLAVQAAAQGLSVVISTGDKDMAQLVTDQISLINTMTDVVMDQAMVVEKFGIGPELIIDYLALMGDKVDNIPGAPGVGEKTALALLTGIGNIDAIYADLDAIAGLGFRGSKTMAKKLTDHKEDVILSRTLATIKLDVELPQTVDSLLKQPADTELLQRLYSKYAFKNWLNQLVAGMTADDGIGEEEEAIAAQAMDNQPVDYHTVLTQQALTEWISRLKQSEIFAFDTETDGLNVLEANLVGVSFATESGQAAYVPLAHDYLGAPEQLDRDAVIAQLKPLLEDPQQLKVGQNLKFDANILARYGVIMQGIQDDTMIASYVYNSVAGRHDMDSLALRCLQHHCTSFEQIAGKGKQQQTFNQIPLEQAAHYAAEDADITLRLHQHFASRLAAEPSLLKVYREIDMPLIPVLAKMERTGVCLDGPFLHQQSEMLASQLQALETEVYALAGEIFNINSTKQLQSILFDKLGLPVLKKTKAGAASTNEEVLQELALDYPLPKLILSYRGLAKLKNTYTDKLPQLISPLTKRLHTSYHQAVTATGRLSSTDPNLQNIPVRSEEGRRIRQAFIAPQGWQILAIDYSQIELRIMAHLSGDAALLNAFAQGLDIHSATAAEVMGITVEEVTKEQRRRAKAINFGLIYGMSAFGLAKQLSISRQDAQQYMDTYFERYPRVQTYMEKTREQAIQMGYVETEYGRRLYLPEIKSSNGLRRKGAERAAINAPMQGTAADIIKKAMIDVDQWIEQSGDGSVRLLMQVHDELIFEVKSEALPHIRTELTKIMESAAQLSVPLLVESGVGDHWDAAH